MELSENQKKHLRRLGHALKPVVMLGQHGLTEAVTRETDLALAHHDALGRQGDGLQARGTKTVDGHAGDADRAVGHEGDLTGDVGPGGTLGVGTPHQHIFNFRGIDAGAL